MIGNGDLCYKCKLKEMPKWKETSTARACQNCLAIEAKNSCAVRSCTRKPAMRVRFDDMGMEVCFEHSRLDFGQVKRLMEKGEI